MERKESTLLVKLQESKEQRKRQPSAKKKLPKKNKKKRNNMPLRDSNEPFFVKAREDFERMLEEERNRVYDD